MEKNICPKAKKCPIFQRILEGEKLMEAYRNIYCHSGKEGREKCKRFLVSSKVGMCPPDLLPNSTLSVEEIIEQVKLMK